MLGRNLRFKKQAPPTPVAPPVYGQPTSTIPQSSDEPVVLGGEPGAPSATVTGLGVSGEPPIKVPAGPAYKVQGPQTPAQIKAQAEALQLSSAAPLSPEEKATQDARASAAGNLVTFQSNLKLWDQQHPRSTAPDATPEEKQARQDYIDTLLQGSTKEPVEIRTPSKGVDPQKMPDGSYRQLGTNKKGEYSYHQMPEGYVPPEKKTGKLRISSRRENPIARATISLPVSR